MKLAVQVNEGPYQHQATDSAYHFTKAALEKGHEVFRVFFYHDGVNNGTRLTTPPQDDRHIVNRWTELAEKYDLGAGSAGARAPWKELLPRLLVVLAPMVVLLGGLFLFYLPAGTAVVGVARGRPRAARLGLPRPPAHGTIPDA